MSLQLTSDVSAGSRGRIDFRLANESWEALFRAHTTLMRGFLADDIWADLSMREYDVLYTLSKAESPLRLGDVSDGVLLSQPALSRLVDRLVDRGLISRGLDESDRRAVRLRLTQKGRDLQRRVGLKHAKKVATKMSVLSDDELQTLKDLTAKLIAH